MTPASDRAPDALARRLLTVLALTVSMLMMLAAAAHAGSDTYEVEFPEDRTVEGSHDHLVEAGEYLEMIAEEYGLTESGSWRVLYDANDHIDDPDLIHVGDEIRIPEEGESLTERAASAAAPDPEPEAETVSSTSADTGGSSGSASESQESSEPAPEPAPAPAQSTSNSVWDALAECESNGNWQIDTGNGFYGGLQFEKRSWDWAGGQRYAEWPHHASREQQIAVAERLLAIHPAGWGAWPACASMLGLR